ncbi:MAG: hypothetical protein ACK4TB_06800 [Gemmobacter sp.]
MPDPTETRPPLDLGRNLPPPPSAARVTATEIVAGMLSLLWLGGVVAWFTFTDPAGTDPAGVAADPLLRGPGIITALFVVFLPIAVIWVAAVTARSVRALRDEAERLKIAVDAMRASYVQQQQAQAAGLKAGSVERKLDEIAAAARQTETAIVTFASRRDPAPPAPRTVARPAPAAPAGAEDQPALALGTVPEPPRAPLPVEDYVRALNFPDSAEDRDGFRALRAALDDRDTGRLIRAAQDVLTLLAQDGIYMDDLRPDRARPEVWRRFAQGERGRGLAALGGIRDRSSLALTAGRMRSDPVFRDAAHHFLRQFDRSFQQFEPVASDQDIAALAETRTARAFMLFGRVAGVFD